MTPGGTAHGTETPRAHPNGGTHEWRRARGAAFALAPGLHSRQARPTSHVDDANAVGRRLRTARKRAGLTQRDLARAGCSSSYVSQVEAGNRTPSLQLLRRLAEYLGVSEDYLARGACSRREHDLRLVEATAAFHLGQIGVAAAAYHDVFAESREATLQSEALEGLARLSMHRGDAHGAVSLFQAALETTGDTAALRPALAEGLGRAHEALGETQAAIALYERCLAQSERTADALRVRRFAALLGRALVKSGDLERARCVLAQARDTSALADDAGVRARSYWTQAKRASEDGDIEAAQRCAAVALAIGEASDDARLLAVADAIAGELGGDAAGRPR